MSFKMRILPEAPILEISHAGTVNREAVQAAGVEAVKLIAAKKLSRLLLDLSQAIVSMSTTDAFEHHSTILEQLPRGMRVAVVCSPENWAPDEVRFTENVVQNRGLAWTSFQNRDDAIAWLVA